MIRCNYYVFMCDTEQTALDFKTKLGAS
ncbi:hypothetical protein BN874_2940002 [Candidatus Contendobacter odensis Run_B_J11]|uniref:Uncharacterized protein n=1 Tax=Candidatus Contendobacter odensis Run_B_J11 TaxID=1400861 RepID=A0A7U7J386_9GAMM|nr:hypothetical protein BN874_2940002 [Candidatus Contendobacter odensis Run_B_J11]